MARRREACRAGPRRRSQLDEPDAERAVRCQRRPAGLEGGRVPSLRLLAPASRMERVPVVVERREVGRGQHVADAFRAGQHVDRCAACRAVDAGIGQVAEDRPAGRAIEPVIGVLLGRRGVGRSRGDDGEGGGTRELGGERRLERWRVPGPVGVAITGTGSRRGRVSGLASTGAAGGGSTGIGCACERGFASASASASWPARRLSLEQTHPTPPMSFVESRAGDVRGRSMRTRARAVEIGAVVDGSERSSRDDPGPVVL